MIDAMQVFGWWFQRLVHGTTRLSASATVSRIIQQRRRRTVHIGASCWRYGSPKPHEKRTRATSVILPHRGPRASLPNRDPWANSRVSVLLRAGQAEKRRTKALRGAPAYVHSEAEAPARGSDVFYSQKDWTARSN